MSRKTRISQRHIKTLENELRMLQHLRDDLVIVLQDYKKEFSEDMSQLESMVTSQKDAESQDEAELSDANSLRIDPSAKDQRWRKTEDGWEKEGNSEQNENKPVSEKLIAPSWAKKLYKKIAIVSHPDKTINDHRHEKLKKIFQESVTAMEEGDFKKLIGYALELDIPTSSVGVELLPLLKQRLVVLKEEVKALKESWEWVWGESMGLIELRSQIAQSYLSSKKIDVNIEELSHIISQIEDGYDDRENC